jgi:hypothetical protein
VIVRRAALREGDGETARGELVATEGTRKGASFVGVRLELDQHRTREGDLEEAHG